MNDKIVIDKVKISNGHLTYIPKERDKNKEGRGKQISIKTIECDSILFTLMGNKKGKTWERSSVLIDKFIVDKVTVDTLTGLDFMVQTLKLDSFKYMHSLELHQLSSSSIQWIDQSLIIDNFGVRPLLSKSEFAKNIYGRKEMFNLDVDSIVFKNLNWNKLIAEGEIEAEALLAKSPNFHIFSNENIKRTSPKKKYKGLPTKRTLESSLKYRLGAINLENARIEYERLGLGREKSGSLFWNHLMATIDNVTNDSLLIKDKPLTKIDIKSRFMDASQLKLYATFDLTNANSAYELQAEMENMPMEPLNQMMEEVALIRVKSGMVNKFKLNLKADDFKSEGTMDMYYEDFSVRMLNEDFEETRKPLKWLGARLLIRNNNKEGDAKPGFIEVERDRSSSIWNQLWISVFDGFKSIVFPGFMDGQ
jgi:hypothetical protein